MLLGGDLGLGVLAAAVTPYLSQVGVEVGQEHSRLEDWEGEVCGNVWTTFWNLTVHGAEK